MQSQSTSPPILFANTGVQIISFPLRPDARCGAAQAGLGWQYCKCKAGDKITEYGYLQWQVARNRFFLAVDTTMALDDADSGYFAKASSLAGDFSQGLTGLLGVNGEPFSGIPEVEFVIRPAAAEGGEPREVHMLVDFGNSRTGALLMEFRGDMMREPLMTPLQLANRYHLDCWDGSEDLLSSDASWWFSSRTHWCTAPYLPAPRIEKTVYKQRNVKGILGRKTTHDKVTVLESPRTFEDFSMVRLGREADDLASVMSAEGDIRTGVSSPKRYLWAKDAGWLEGAIWHMADPFGRYDSKHHTAPLKGPLLRFFGEEDSDDDSAPGHEESPLKPRHAPRITMTGALYEMLCQAYAYVNSPAYRHITGDSTRMRQLRSLTLTYPSGMIREERAVLQKQACKATRIFMQTVGKNQSSEPEVKLTIDEASAAHLAYIWSEVQKLGRNSSLWFSIVGRQPAGRGSENDAETQPEQATPRPVKRPAGARARARAMSRRTRAESGSGTTPEVRIACIDVGGGTSDLMIAKYDCTADLGGDVIQGETLHRDGISVGGDYLVKRLLERIIVPHFVDVVGLEVNDAETLFGKEVPVNRPFRAQRIHWINRLLVPLAQAYLESAVSGTADEVTHTDPNVVAPEVVQSLQETINRIWGPGTYNVRQELGLYYEAEEFESVADEVFGDLLLDFCESIAEHQADVVLLAGQPTKLGYIRELVETYLPLPRSRIISMYGRYAGAWYPYQNPDNRNPGVIVDPKSTVVVGAAIEFASRHGMLPQFKFRTTDTAAKMSYYWGVMTGSGIFKERVIFEPLSEGEGAKVVQRTEMRVSAQNLTIGRKRRPRDEAQASPVYLLRIERGEKLGEIDVLASLERKVGPDGEEELSLEAVEGEVDGQPAALNYNVFFEWRTLGDERYYLDTGSLDRLELG